MSVPSGRLAMAVGPCRATIIVLMFFVAMVTQSTPGAGAVILPGAIFTYGDFHEVDFPGSRSYDVQDSNGQFVAVVQASGAPVPEADLQLHLSYTGTSATHHSTTNLLASVTYSAVVNPLPGAPAVTSVPILIGLNGSASVSGTPAVSATASSQAAFVTGRADADSSGVSNQSYSVSQVVDQPVGQVFGASAGVFVQASFFGPGSVEMQAVADPIISIDPSYPDAKFFEVQFSANLPEPTASVLLFASAAALLKRRPWRAPRPR